MAYPEAERRAEGLDEIPALLPSGYAALLSLFGLR